MSSLVIDTTLNRFSYSNGDNAMVQSANLADKAKITTLESENEKLQEEVRELTSQNQSLQAQVAKAKGSVNVDISNNTQVAKPRQMSEKTKEFMANNHINYANESVNFSKQNIVAQAGSAVAAQANSSPAAVQRLISS